MLRRRRGWSSCTRSPTARPPRGQGDPEIVFCVDEFGPLNLQPRPGRQWAAVSGKGKEPGRAPRPRMRATYTRTAGVRHLFAAYEPGEDKLYGHIKPRKTRAQPRPWNGSCPGTPPPKTSAHGRSRQHPETTPKQPPQRRSPRTRSRRLPARPITGLPNTYDSCGREPPSQISEVPRAFRTVHPLGWTIWKGERIAPAEEELLSGIQG